MKINVFLDDYCKCFDGYVLVEMIDECIDLLRLFDVEYLLFDYDLFSKIWNGLMFVYFMVKYYLYVD